MRVLPFLPATLWLAMVTYLSVSSKVQLPNVEILSADKLGHAAAYGLLVWLLLWGFRKSQNWEAVRWERGLAFSFSTAYGAGMEWVQGTFFPNRFFEYDDMLANAAGAFLAVMLASLWVEKTPAKS